MKRIQYLVLVCLFLSVASAHAESLILPGTIIPSQPTAATPAPSVPLMDSRREQLFTFLELDKSGGTLRINLRNVLGPRAASPLSHGECRSSASHYFLILSRLCGKEILKHKFIGIFPLRIGGIIDGDFRFTGYSTVPNTTLR